MQPEHPKPPRNNHQAHQDAVQLSEKLTRLQEALREAWENGDDPERLAELTRQVKDLRKRAGVARMQSGTGERDKGREG